MTKIQVGLANLIYSCKILRDATPKSLVILDGMSISASRGNTSN